MAEAGEQDDILAWILSTPLDVLEDAGAQGLQVHGGGELPQSAAISPPQRGNELVDVVGQHHGVGSVALGPVAAGAWAGEAAGEGFADHAAGSRKRPRRVGPAETKSSELRHEIRRLERERALLKQVLGVREELDPPGESLSELLSRLEEAVYARKARPSKIRRLTAKVWDVNESFGVKRMSALLARFVETAFALVDVQSMGLAAKMLVSKRETTRRGVAAKLDLSEAQQVALSSDLDGHQARAEVFARVCDVICLARQHLDRAGDLFSSFMSAVTDTLRPEQLAKFLLWVHRDPACKETLDSLWKSTMDKLDADNRASRTAAATKNTYDVSERQSVLREVRVAALDNLRLLLDKARRATVEPDALYRLFCQDVLLQDRSAGTQVRGPGAVLDYCERLPGVKAVQPLRVSLDLDGRAQCAWDLLGLDGGTYRLSATVYFAPDSRQIARVSLGWLQTDVHNGGGGGGGGGGYYGPATATGTGMTGMYVAVAPKNARGSGTGGPGPAGGLLEARLRAARGMPQVFETDDPSESRKLLMQALAPDAILVDSRLGGEFRGWDQIVQYILRLRQAFAKLEFGGVQAEAGQGGIVKCLFTVRGLYSGNLSDGTRHCEFGGNATVVFAQNLTLISELYLSFDTAGLTHQIS